MTKLIDSIELPCGLRSLSADQLKSVAKELREELIESVSDSGGHFASSLGATELSVALHHVFDTPHDKLVWDVGHQAYIHKMLTGRRSRMPSIRKRGGLSGFLKRNESEYDAFGAGHAGTSISAAVGMAAALRHSGDQQKVVAIIGDGSLTSGMAFEALNHAGDLGLKNLVVVLNDNEMSISPNVGAISWLFSKAVTSDSSTKARFKFKELYNKGYIPEFIYRTIDKAEEAAQGFFATPAMLFNAFGFRYIGPVDGHDVTQLVEALHNAKTQDVPVVVHAVTTKGKGYQPAESDPIAWHGVVPFDRHKGEFIKGGGRPPPSYTSVFADTIIEIASKDPKVIAITAAMPGGTGIDKVQAALPQQCYDVGICEQHAVTFAAGLACQGYRPVAAIYSTFLQRGFDQVVHDVCIQNLPVMFAMDRGGVVGNDGETHQGVFDIAYLRPLPGIVLMSPKDENELRQMLYTGLTHNGPTAIRYPRGNGIGVAMDRELHSLPIGKAEVLCTGSDALIIGYGPVVQSAIAAAAELSKNHGITVTVINARFAKPLDQELLRLELPRYPVVCTIEDHAVQGGFGSAVLEYANDSGIALQSPIHRFGIGDEFVPHATQAEQYSAHGYDTASLVRYLESRCARRQFAAAV